MNYNSFLPYEYVNDDGIVYLKNGNVAIGMELEFPSLYTLSQMEIETIQEFFFQVYSMLPEVSFLHKQDYFLNHGNNVIDRSEIEKTYGLYEDYDRLLKQIGRLEIRVFLFMGSVFYFQHKVLRTGRFPTKKNAFFPTKKLNKVSTTYINSLMKCRNQINSICDNYNGLVKIKKNLTRDDIIGENGMLSQYFGFNGSSPKSINFNMDEIQTDSYLSSMVSIDNANLFNSEILNNEVVDNRIGFSVSPAFSIGARIGHIPHIYNQIFVKHPINYYDSILTNYKNSLLAVKSKKEEYGETENFVEYVSDVKKYVASLEDFFTEVHFNIQYFYKPKDKVQIEGELDSALSLFGVKVGGESGSVQKTIGKQLHNTFLASSPYSVSEMNENKYFLGSLKSMMKLMTLEYGSTSFGLKGTHHLDLQDQVVVLPNWEEAKNNGLIENFGFLTIGTSGSGKSAFINAFICNAILNFEKCFVFDKGNSYYGIIQQFSHISISFVHDPDKKQYYSFSPFHITKKEYNNKNYYMDVIKPMLISLLKTLVKFNTASGKDLEIEETLFGNLIDAFYHKVFDSKEISKNISFTDFYNFVKNNSKSFVKDGVIDINKINEFLYITEKYTYKKGSDFLEHLLNRKDSINLKDYAFVHFEMERLEAYPVIKSIVFLFLSMTMSREIMAAHHKFSFYSLIVEEVWDCLSDDFILRFMNWLNRTGRKVNARLGLITQNYGDITTNEIGKSIAKNSDTKYLTAVDDVDKDNVEQIMTTLGISLNEYKVLQNLKNVDNISPNKLKTRAMAVKFRNYDKIIVVRNYLSYYLLLLFQTDFDQKDIIQKFAKEKGLKYDEVCQIFAKNYKFYLSLQKEAKKYSKSDQFGYFLKKYEKYLYE